MPQFLPKLLQEIEDVELDNIPEPKREVQEGEKVAGVLADDFSKKFYVVYLAAKKKEDQYKRIGIIAKLRIWFAFGTWHYVVARKKRYKLIRDLFLDSVREAIPEIRSTDDVVFCKGWQVVVNPSIYDIFKDLRSGGFFHM